MYKKIISIFITIILALSCFSITAFAGNGEYEMPKLPIPNSSNTNNNNSDSGNTLPNADNQFETDPIKLDNNNDNNSTASVSIKKCSISGIKNKTYTGKAITQSVTVKNGKTVLKNKTDYTVSYSNNKKIGTATIKITGKGKYKDTYVKTFKINPIPTNVKTVTISNKKIKINWKKQTNGYQLQYSTSKKFKKKYTTVKNIKNVNTTTKAYRIDTKKRVYVRIRTYKTVGNKKYYSSWSSLKSAKAK